MKSQVLADFLVECTWAEERLEEPCFPPLDDVAEEDWILYVDGASNSLGSGAGLILTNSEGVVAECALRFLFSATNNQAEYEALLFRMKLAKELGVKCLRVFTDSLLVFGQVKGEYEARDPTLSRYSSKVLLQALTFTRFNVSHILRAKNARADALSRLATSINGALGRVFVEYLDGPSIDAAESLPMERLKL